MGLLYCILICIFSTSFAQLPLRNDRGTLMRSINYSMELLSQVKRPPLGGLTTISRRKEPLSVNIGVYFESLGNFKETKMSFEVDLYIYMSWKDPVFRHNKSDFILINDDPVRKKLWLPDLYFANAIQSKTHKVTVPNFNMFLSPDGTFAYSSRVTLTVACNLDLKDYPMDRQKCYIKIQSYAYIAQRVKVTWFKKQPIGFNPKIDLPEYDINNATADYCNGSYRYAITRNDFKFDEFSCLITNLYLTRRMGFNMLQNYLPSGLIVIISWVLLFYGMFTIISKNSFWIDRRSVPARVTLSFTTLLTMTNIGIGMRYTLPQVSYAKAIDIWFGVCILLVFLTLVEFGIVNNYMRASDKYEKLAKKYTEKDEDFSLSPVFSSELQRSYSAMMRMRRKNSVPSLLIRGLRRGSELRRKSNATLRSLTLDVVRKTFTDPILMRSKEESAIKHESMNGRIVDDQNSIDDSVYQTPKAVRKGNRDIDSIDSFSLYISAPSSPYGRKKSYTRPFKNGKIFKRKKSLVAFHLSGSHLSESDESVEEKEGYLWRRKQSSEPSIQSSVKPDQKLSIEYLEMSKMLSRRALKVDKISRMLFPIFFALFNIFYWSYYMIIRRNLHLDYFFFSFIYLFYLIICLICLICFIYLLALFIYSFIY